MHKKLLKDIAAISPGYPFRGSIFEYDEDDDTEVVKALALQMRDTSEDEPIDWNGVVKTALPGRKEPDWLRKGDIVFVARGSNNYATLIEDAPDNVVITPSFFLVRLKPEINVLPGFLAWQLNQEPVRKLLQASSQGSAQPSIRKAVLAELLIIIPDDPIQKKIIAMVNCMKAQKETLRALEQNQQKIMAAIANDILR